MARLRKTAEEDLRFNEEIAFNKGTMVALLNEAADRADLGVAYMDRLTAGHPSRGVLRARAEDLIVRLQAAVQRPHDADSIRLFEDLRTVERDIIAWIGMAKRVDSRFNELRAFHAEIEQHVIEALVDVLRVIEERIEVLQRRSLTLELRAVELARCERRLDWVEERMNSWRGTFPQSRSAIDVALKRVANVRAANPRGKPLKL
jgi:hypothetical protein